MDGSTPSFEITERKTPRTLEEQRRFDWAKQRARHWRTKKPNSDRWIFIGKEEDNVLGLTREFYFNEETLQYGIKKIPKLDALFRQNRIEEASTTNMRLGNKESLKVASIPQHLLFGNTDWAKAYRGKDDAWFRKMLNDPDYRNLRTCRGRL